MKAEWKLVLWIIAPFLVCNILYLVWIPGVLDQDAMKKGRELTTSEAFGIGLRWYVVFPAWTVLAILFSGGLFFQTVFALAAAVWVMYLVKFRAEYIRTRVHP